MTIHIIFLMVSAMGFGAWFVGFLEQRTLPKSHEARWGIYQALVAICLWLLMVWNIIGILDARPVTKLYFVDQPEYIS